jgi:hypothetical protein
MADLNNYIKKSHIKAVLKFAGELELFRIETGNEAEATLYEDAYTSFTLSEIKVENGQLCYKYDGTHYRENVVNFDEDEGKYYEDEGMESIMEYVKFWRSCLRRAKRYWSMDVEKLDAIQSGEQEDDEEEEEEEP